MTNIEENIIEIAWAHQMLCDTNRYRTYHNTDEAKEKIMELAFKFEETHQNVDWDSDDADYVETIADFAEEELTKWDKEVFR